MRIRKRGVLALALAALVAGGCMRSPAPRGWLSAPPDAAREAYGAWATAGFTDSARALHWVAGELIAVSEDSLWVLDAHGPRLVAVSRQALTDVELYRFDPGLGRVVWWTVAGTLATISHGIVLILSAPAWILTGSLVAATISRAPRLVTSEPSLLRPYARFPQGIPAGLDRAAIKWKDAPRR